MELFLTSKIGATAHKNGFRVPGRIDNRYGFLDHFQQRLKTTRQMLYISSTWGYSKRVADWFENTVDALNKDHIVFEKNILVNGQNAHGLRTMIPQSDVIFLSGGHLPTQNKFFQDIGLRELLTGFNGIVVAQSAGSMNCAETVYVCPELPGESMDPSFERFRPGLGLTGLNIIPHYNGNQNLILDGKRFYEEIVCPGTFKVPIYLLTDGAYFYIHKNKTSFLGEIYLFYHGKRELVPSFSQ